MNLLSVHHVSLNVKDVEAARYFYIDQLGLTLIDRPDLGFPGLWMQVGDQQIHLLQLNSGDPLKEQHFAFHVGDIKAEIAELRSKDIQCSDASEIPGVCLQAFFHDPSGNLLELNQPL